MKLTLFVGIGSYLLGQFWPSLGEQTISQLLIKLGFATVMGSAWLALRYEKLFWARLALIANGAVFTYAIFVFTKHNFLEKSASLFDGLAVYAGCGSLVALFWWSQNEVSREISRRNSKHQIS